MRPRYCRAPGCGETLLPGVRRDALYCSRRCNGAAYRARRAAEAVRNALGDDGAAA